MSDEFPHQYVYQPSWIDNGQTCEPCPLCGTNLYWGEHYSAGMKKKMRHLICRREGGCKYRSKKIVGGDVKARTEREYLYARFR